MRGPVGREGKHHFVGVLARGSRQDGATDSRLLVEGPVRCRRRVAACAAGNGTRHTPRQVRYDGCRHRPRPPFLRRIRRRCRVAKSRGRRRLPPGQFRRRSTRYEQSYERWHARRVGDSVPRGTHASFFLCAHRMHPVHMKNGRTAARWAVTESSVRNAGGLDRTYLTALAQTLLRGSSHLCWNARAYLFHSPAPFSSVSCARDVCECRSCCRYVCA